MITFPIHIAGHSVCVHNIPPYGGYGNNTWYKVLTLLWFVSVQVVRVPQAKKLWGEKVPNLSKFWSAEHENGIKH